MKRCNKCLIEKSLDEFFKDKTHSSGRYSICKLCKQKKTSEWREANRDHYNKMMSAYQRKNKLQMRLYRYGLTPIEYELMRAAQNGKCAICEKIPSTKRPLAIDHSHDTGKIRALLCYGCNRALHALEDKDLFQRTQAYLQKHS